MASRARGRQPARQRQQRATSNIFAMFDQSQIQEFKEAFNIIDHDRVCLTCQKYWSIEIDFFRMVLLIMKI